MSRIVIVDNHETEVRIPLMRQLGRAFGSEEIQVAGNGAEALSLLSSRNDPVGVIILDVMMPVMDGIAACRAIRANPNHDGVYIVMLTGRDGGLPEGLGVGADVYLHKPCAIEELIAVVKKGLLESKKQYTLKQEHADLKKKWLQFEEELERLRLAGVGVGMEDHFAMETRVSWVELVGDVGSGSR
ncbi:MAG: response regulator [Magnetococcales bacterium]|nr:response regulator [Magnetococcales bacterium]